MTISATSWDDGLLGQIAKELDLDQRQWLHAGITVADRSDAQVERIVEQLAFYSSAARRTVGTRAIELRLPIQQPHRRFIGHSVLKIRHWNRADCVRAVFLRRALTSNPREPDQLLTIAYRYADEQERIALLQAIYWLDIVGSSLEFVLEIQRTNSLDLLNGLAFHNPYPAAYYTDRTFNQLVLKCLFNGLDISQILGLRQRKNADLHRMCHDYLHERLAADRSIPASLWLALEGEKLTDQIVQCWNTQLHHPEAGHRYLAVLALIWHDSLPDQLRDNVKICLHRETLPKIKSLLESLTKRPDFE